MRNDKKKNEAIGLKEATLLVLKGSTLMTISLVQLALILIAVFYHLAIMIDVMVISLWFIIPVALVHIIVLVVISNYRMEDLIEQYLNVFISPVKDFLFPDEVSTGTKKK